MLTIFLQNPWSLNIIFSKVNSRINLRQRKRVERRMRKEVIHLSRQSASSDFWSNCWWHCCWGWWWHIGGDLKVNDQNWVDQRLSFHKDNKQTIYHLFHHYICIFSSISYSRWRKTFARCWPGFQVKYWWQDTKRDKTKWCDNYLIFKFKPLLSKRSNN